MALTTAFSQATDDERWSALIERDANADGQFVYAVKSTGVYCRPSCGSRRPNRENVLFFNSWGLAESAGFRACRKCRPRGGHSVRHDVVLKACRFIDEADAPPSLGETAAHVGLSVSHFHRLFSKTLGITPREYATAVRDRRFRSQLKRRKSVTEAIYAAGFESSSRCYDGSVQALGMTPGSYRNGGRDVTIRYAAAKCRLGWLAVAATDVGICLIEFGDSVAELREMIEARFHSASLIASDGKFQKWVRQVVAFVDQPAQGLDLPFDIQGTVFQRQVWEALRRIPPGTTATYSEIARLIGQPSAARAVAGACAANPLAVAIPCHRVVRSNGDSGGYKWGEERKAALRESEEGRADSKRL